MTSKQKQSDLQAQQNIYSSIYLYPKGHDTAPVRIPPHLLKTTHFLHHLHHLCQNISLKKNPNHKNNRNYSDENINISTEVTTIITSPLAFVSK